MSELDRIEEKGDIENLLKPTTFSLGRLAREGSKFKASDEYFLVKEEETYSPDKVSGEDILL